MRNVTNARKLNRPIHACPMELPLTRWELDHFNASVTLFIPTTYVLRVFNPLLNPLLQQPGKRGCRRNIFARQCAQSVPLFNGKKFIPAVRVRVSWFGHLAPCPTKAGRILTRARLMEASKTGRPTLLLSSLSVPFSLILVAVCALLHLVPSDILPQVANSSISSRLP